MLVGRKLQDIIMIILPIMIQTNTGNSIASWGWVDYVLGYGWRWRPQRRKTYEHVSLKSSGFQHPLHSHISSRWHLRNRYRRKTWWLSLHDTRDSKLGIFHHDKITLNILNHGPFPWPPSYSSILFWLSSTILCFIIIIINSRRIRARNHVSLSKSHEEPQFLTQPGQLWSQSRHQTNASWLRPRRLASNHQSTIAAHHRPLHSADIRLVCIDLASCLFSYLRAATCWLSCAVLAIVAVLLVESKNVP